MKGIRTRLGGLFSRPAPETDAPTPRRAQKDAMPGSEGASATPSPDSDPAASVVGLVDDLRRYIASKARGRWSAEEVDGGINLWDAGYVDSLSYVEFLVYIETQYGVAVPDVELTDRLSTLHALATFISTETRKRANGPRA